MVRKLRESGAGWLDFDSVIWRFILEDLTEEQADTLTEFFHIGFRSGFIDFAKGNVDRGILVLEPKCQLSGKRCQSTGGLRHIVQGTICDDEELVDATLLEFIHERKGHDLEVFLELSLSDSAILIVRRSHHILYQSVCCGRLNSTVSGCVFGV